MILFFCAAVFEPSYAQKPKWEQSKETIITKSLENNQNPLQDTAFLNQLVRFHGDSIRIYVDSLLKDSAFLQSISDSSGYDQGEFASSAYKIQFPIEPLGWTSDFENIFSKEQITELDSIISGFEQETTNEIAIVTIHSSWTTKESFDSLTLAIARNWGIGKKDKNNGILIGISTGLRSIRINNGYGIETKLSDLETKRIIEYLILPEFKKGNYFDGTKNGLLALMQGLR